MKLVKLLSLVALSAAFLFTAPTQAQDTGSIAGTVTDSLNGGPIPGVNVVIVGTQQGSATNADGNFEIAGVEEGTHDVRASFVGYEAKTVEGVEVNAGETTELNIELVESAVALEEIVAIGYGTQRRGDVSASISSVDVAEASTGQITSPQDLIQGRVSGVNILENSGEPGAGVSVRIRGTTSISAGSDPLYVIDGVAIDNTNLTPGGASQGGVTSSSTTNPMAMLNPGDIESIDVLKDAAATAIYGSQGANGVILITTKEGQAGTVMVDYSGKLSAGILSRELDLLTGDEYRQAVRDLLGSDQPAGPTTDWLDESTRSTVSHEHNLSFSGGGESTRYRASLGYMNQPGLLDNSGIERVNGRVNASHSTFDDRLRLTLNLTASYFQRNHAFFNQGGGFEGGAIKGMIAFDPRLPIRDDDGEYTEYSNNIRNPIALLNRITDITDQNRVLGNFTTEIDILEGLTAQGTFGVDVGDAIRRTYVPGSGPSQWVGQSTNGLARQAERSLSNLVLQSTLRYNRDLFEDHRFEAVGGYEYKREVFQEVGTEVHDFVTDALDFNNLGSGVTLDNSFSNKQLVALVSFFGRVNYDIQNTYLLTATLRRDGSSVFGADERFAWFPSASAAWRISNESFMQGIDWLGDLKLRASYGLSGNQAVPPYQALATLSPSSGFKVPYGPGEDDVIGVAPERAESSDLKWEQTRELNIGLDFLAGRFEGALDIYRRDTEDLLLDVRVPPPSFDPFLLQNVGSVENMGVEFSLNADLIDREYWSFGLGGNISSNRNEITDLGGRGTIDHSPVAGAGQSGVNAQRLEAGHPIGSFYGPVFVEVNEDGEEVYRAEGGGTTTVLGDAVREYIGNAVPDFDYGLNLDFQYRSLDLSAFFRGSYGAQVFNNTALEFTTKGNLEQGINVLEEALTDGTNENHVPVYSSRWIEDASFFRLDNLTLGYNLPAPAEFSLRQARLYITARNLFVITPYSGFDPEVNTNVTGQDLGFRSLARPARGIDYTSYPRPRTFTLGVQLGF